MGFSGGKINNVVLVLALFPVSGATGLVLICLCFFSLPLTGFFTLLKCTTDSPLSLSSGLLCYICYKDVWLLLRVRPHLPDLFVPIWTEGAGVFIILPLT